MAALQSMLLQTQAALFACLSQAKIALNNEVGRKRPLSTHSGQTSANVCFRPIADIARRRLIPTVLSNRVATDMPLI